ncbi:MAG: CRISPR-associated endonuclease Cas2 [Candidatus Eremiobacterota bacterium]
MFIIVTYDITNDRLRNKLYELLKDYGNPVQYSVFECNLTQTQFIDMKKKTEGFLQDEKDSIRYYILPRREKIRIIIKGKDKTQVENSIYIVG